MYLVYKGTLVRGSLTRVGPYLVVTHGSCRKRNHGTALTIKY